MKHIKLFEQFINEKAYRLTGHYATKGIIGKVMQAFKLEIGRVQFDGDSEATLKEVNKEWRKFFGKATDIIIKEVANNVKDLESEVAFISADLSTDWIKDVINNINSEGSSELYITPGEFVINIGFMDGADANRYSRRLGGMTNRPSETGYSEDIYGSFDMSVGDNNVEIRGMENISIDAR